MDIVKLLIFSLGVGLVITSVTVGVALIVIYVPTFWLMMITLGLLCIAPFVNIKRNRRPNLRRIK